VYLNVTEKMSIEGNIFDHNLVNSKLRLDGQSNCFTMPLAG